MRLEPATGEPGESFPLVRGLVLPALLASVSLPADGSTLETTCSAGHYPHPPLANMDVRMWAL